MRTTPICTTPFESRNLNRLQRKFWKDLLGSPSTAEAALELLERYRDGCQGLDRELTFARATLAQQRRHRKDRAFGREWKIATARLATFLAQMDTDGILADRVLADATTRDAMTGSTGLRMARVTRTATSAIARFTNQIPRSTPMVAFS